MGTGLLDRTLLYVTGKGGVGKTTVAAALGLGGTGK
jgi:anion-transporting  ArsA/GET3 family ATPase